MTTPMKPTGFVIPDYDPSTIQFVDEPFITDAHANPSETVHPELETFMTNLRKVRDEVEARELRR